MAIILNIDTAVEIASVCLSNDTEVMKLAINESQKDHAAWLHSAIRDLTKDAGLQITDINAVAISIGPGSYTGLRIGLSAAKGLCYALNIPLIVINTLEMMAHSVKKVNADFICPMIDARRMEVFAAVYNKSLEEISKPFALIVDINSFADLLSSNKVIFCGNGSKKLQNILYHDNAIFSDNVATAADLVHLSSKTFAKKKFANLAYTEPLYIKEFYSTAH
jgi:tRNA threonylcarbamoyladenosine biosynthesis protein TsaB